ncbi:ABC transporter permease [Nakamurella sp. YIM 132087]|uniref:ABC transporter permease n=1 Tax=Nakamurella alba TaxID=2665158 RepID=A0A7K1FN64_9ACTN|nr:ABC transporter permease [Nakamurella alba]MTD14759.1 ABC transporter permease [Nakamurella alba]
MTTLTPAPGTTLAQHRLPDAPVRPQRFSRLLTVELRKMVDTRSGVAVLGVTFLLVIGILGWLVVRDGSSSWMRFSGVMQFAGMLIPVIGLLGITSEWSQRTALTTFTLSPRRGRVLLAKFVASVALAMAVFVVVIGLAVAAVYIDAMISGGTADMTGFGDSLRSMAILTVLQVTMALGFGALVAQTAVAVVTYFMAPTVVLILSDQLLGENAKWLNVFQTYDRLSSGNPWVDLGPTVVSVLLWVVLPITAGVVRSMRREVK